MSQLGLLLQETRAESRTILGLLNEQMDGVDGVPRRRRSFKERFGFIGIGCCGATRGFRSSSSSSSSQLPQQQISDTDPVQDPSVCVGPNPTASSSSTGSSSSNMNLAAALAAERQLRRPPVETNIVGGGRTSGTPWRVSLMRLLEETENGDTVAEKAVSEVKVGGVAGNDSVCCVCMGRNKGAAFIPCGHTFCRVCSRELWLNRGSCPLCNRSIIEILDIF
ncbi:uncharacterized protein LOC131599880 [Vicia villosa]|uniref:uncharacterized protein LOC131599880 n=1 Tax=Vicia villosa TaxID=3911 RepID=UPI00273C08B0|nr:uncharacterized protein LOC131599880 [Vicia villosa]